MTYELTPALAVELVATFQTRVPPPFLVAEKLLRYTDTMASGGWQQPSTIVLDAAGQLLDGWHRCHAVIASGMSIPINVSVSHQEYV
jgi:hypothetical protein